MNETPNFYFSEKEAKSILEDMGIALGESMGGDECVHVFVKIKQVYPHLTKDYWWISETLVEN